MNKSEMKSEVKMSGIDILLVKCRPDKNLHKHELKGKYCESPKVRITSYNLFYTQVNFFFNL